MPRSEAQREAGRVIYVWLRAQEQCNGRKHGMEGNHRKSAEPWWRVERMILEEDWSPAQVAGVLRCEGLASASRPFTTTSMPT